MRFFALSLVVLGGSAAASSLMPLSRPATEIQWSPETLRAMHQSRDFRERLEGWRTQLRTGSATLGTPLPELAPSKPATPVSTATPVPPTLPAASDAPR